MSRRFRGDPHLSGMLVMSLLLGLLAAPLVFATAAAEEPPSFVLKWGSLGSGEGELNNPVGVAVDSAGNVVYVAEWNNHRIQKFTSSGGFLAKWGSFGSVNGQFNRPFGVAVDSFGNVYVADRYNHRIQKFNENGTWLATWGSGSSGSGNGQFSSPTNVAVDSFGNVYVADEWNHRIQKFSSDGTFQTKWGTNGTGDGRFDYPYSVAVDSFGNVYVADTENYRIQKFTSSGTFQAKWGSYGIGDGQFDRPHSVAVDAAGNVYVAEMFNNRIQKFAYLVAEAGMDQTVHPGDSISLDGSGSKDILGRYPLAYAWSVVSKPAGSHPTLQNETTVSPSFSPDLWGDYTIQLVVTNTIGIASNPDTAKVSTINVPPVADAGADQAIISIGSTVTLDGSKSYDEDGDDLTYSWSFMSRPEGSGATLSDPAAVTPSFPADVHGDYEIQLIVSDPWTSSASDTVKVSFTNVAPVADAGGNQAVNTGDTVTLDGSASRDANGDPLTYQWALVSVPEGSTAALSDPSLVKPTFVVNVAGSYVASLVVNDGFVNSPSSPVTVTATTTASYVNGILKDAIAAINEIDKEAFKNPNMRNALTNKINATIMDVEKGYYEEALLKLDNDILKKMSGCIRSGTPDKTDWIIRCGSGSQQTAFDLLLQAYDLLLHM